MLSETSKVNSPKTASAGRRAAVLYARVSSKDQEKDGFSIPAQQKLLRAYDAEQSLRVLQEFTDVETAMQTGRTSFGAMLAFLRENPTCRIVLVEKTDRLYRNLKDWVQVDEIDLEVHFVKENVVLAPDSRSSEKFMHGIKVLMAKNYIDNLSEEVRKGQLEKAEEGGWPSYAPIGYVNTEGKDGKRTIVPDPERAPLVEKLFEWYVTGDRSIKEVARMAREAGLTFRKGRDPITTSRVHQMLRSRLYTGDFDWAGKTYHGTYEPIVNPEFVAASAGRPRRSIGPAPQAAQAPLRLRRPGPVRALRLRPNGRDPQRPLRLLQVQPLQGQVPRALCARGDADRAIRDDARQPHLPDRGLGVADPGAPREQ